MGYTSYMTSCGLGVLEFVAIVLLTMPKVLLLVIPFGIFISVILYYDRMDRNNELIILEASGLGKKQLVLPSFFLGLVGCFMSYCLTLYLVPKSNMMFRSSLRLVEDNITNLLLTSENFNSLQNITLYLGSRRGDDMNFLVAYSSQKTDSRNKILFAKSAKLLDESHIELYNGNIQDFSPAADNELNILFFDRLILNLKDLYSVRGRSGQRDVDFMYLGELLRMENKTLALRCEIFSRIVTPLFSLILALLSAVSMLSVNFSRTFSGNSLRNVLVYSLCFILAIVFFYLLRLAKTEVLGFHLVTALLLAQIIYIAFGLAGEMRSLG
jgi:lipopolysaccharide export LptBFGC system permease protein LptF